MRPRLVPGFLAALLSATFALGTRATTVAVVVTGADNLPVANAVVEIVPALPVPFKPSATPVVIGQKDIHFVPYLTAVTVGTTVRFTNEDPFDHHVRSEPGGPLGTIPPATEFELRLAAASGGRITSADVKMEQPGAIVLGCHLHSSMHGHVFISESPFVAVTDVGGRAVFGEVPEGAAELRTWTPDQLMPQVPLPRQISGVAMNFEATLNFTPPKPRQRHG